MGALTGEWLKALEPEFRKPYYRKLYETIRQEYARGPVYPPAEDLLSAYELTPLEKVKVVILGQDPYHEPGQAEGWAFSVPEGVRIPPSLENIYKELQRDLGKPVPTSGHLESWVNQGVLLLNATLTVEAHHAGSHQGKGWEELTDAAIMALNEKREHLVFMLWGSYAQRKGQFINRRKHLVLEAPHPSPLSAYRGFIGCGHFSAANDYLVRYHQSPIEW